jgi:hypothetical protein
MAWRPYSLVMTKSGFLLQDRQTAGFLCHTSAAELVATAAQVSVKQRDEWEVIQALRIV